MVNKTIYIKKVQKQIFKLVTKQFTRYYLTGGTALSFYFNHRFSEDLDFFTQKYKKAEPDLIMDFVAQKTGFNFKLDAVQDTPKLIPMKVYSLDIRKGVILKIDFVKDFTKNISQVKTGLHSVDDIYFRKIIAAIGIEDKKNIAGRLIDAGRQSAKDLFDIYYLSNHYEPVSDFFLGHFITEKTEKLIAWYRRFSRMDLKLELLDLVSGIDTNKVIKYLDKEILQVLPDKLIFMR